MTQIAPSATLNDLATAAVVAYNTGKSGEPTMGSQWTAVPLDKIVSATGNEDFAQGMSKLGFSCQVYVNSQTGEVIIADRGTVGNVQNIISDIQITVGAPQQAQPIADQ